MSEEPLDQREARKRAETSEPLKLPERDDREILDDVPDDGDDSILTDNDPAADGPPDA
jgi:hypothetical protein